MSDTINCPSCGSSLPTTAAFCTSCGHRMEQPSTDPTNVETPGLHDSTQVLNETRPAQAWQPAESSSTSGSSNWGQANDPNAGQGASGSAGWGQSQGESSAPSWGQGGQSGPSQASGQGGAGQGAAGGSSWGGQGAPSGPSSSSGDSSWGQSSQSGQGDPSGQSGQSGPTSWGQDQGSGSSSAPSWNPPAQDSGGSAPSWGQQQPSSGSGQWGGTAAPQPASTDQGWGSSSTSTPSTGQWGTPPASSTTQGQPGQWGTAGAAPQWGGQTAAPAKATTSAPPIAAIGGLVGGLLSVLGVFLAWASPKGGDSITAWQMATDDKVGLESKDPFVILLVGIVAAVLGGLLFTQAGKKALMAVLAVAGAVLIGYAVRDWLSIADVVKDIPGAEVSAGIGFYLTLVGGIIALAAGAIGFLTSKE